MVPKNARYRPTRRGRPRATDEDPMVPVVGERVRAAMHTMGLSELALAAALATQGTTVTPSGVHRIATPGMRTTRKSVLDGVAAACGGWPITPEWLSGAEFDWAGAEEMGHVRGAPLPGHVSTGAVLPRRALIELLRLTRDVRDAEARDKASAPKRSHRIPLYVIGGWSSLQAWRAVYGPDLADPADAESDEFAIRSLGMLRGMLSPWLEGKAGAPVQLLKLVEATVSRASSVGDQLIAEQPSADNAAIVAAAKRP